MSADSVLSFPAAPLWRHGDPKTSRDAGLSKLGDRDGHRAKVLITLGLCTNQFGMTDDEIGQALKLRFPPGIYQPSMIKRRKELVDGGWVQPCTDASTGEAITRLTPRGHPAIIWQLSDHGRGFLFELEPATCGAPVERGLNTIVCSVHGSGCTSRPAGI